MDESLPEIEKALGSHFAQFGQRKDNSVESSIFDTLDSDRFAERTSR